MVREPRPNCCGGASTDGGSFRGLLAGDCESKTHHKIDFLLNHDDGDALIILRDTDGVADLCAISTMMVKLWE